MPGEEGKEARPSLLTSKWVYGDLVAEPTDQSCRRYGCPSSAFSSHCRFAVNRLFDPAELSEFFAARHVKDFAGNELRIQQEIDRGTKVARRTGLPEWN